VKNLAKAKLGLERADTTPERRGAIECALASGMPLQEIEEYLDWQDNRMSCRRLAQPVGAFTARPRAS
jgi:DNA-binding transcriptional MerR regulator